MCSYFKNLRIKFFYDLILFTLFHAAARSGFALVKNFGGVSSHMCAYPPSGGKPPLTNTPPPQRNSPVCGISPMCVGSPHICG